MTARSNHPEKDLSSARDMAAAGVPIAKILHFLRKDGLSKVGSIQALVDLGLADFRSAKQLVHFSDAWADRRELDEEFHDRLFEAFDAAKDVGGTTAKET